MKFVVIVSIINFVQLIDFSAADTHSYGHHREYSNGRISLAFNKCQNLSHRIYERILIDDYNEVPKNYTIIYKYFGSYFKPIAYIGIDVDVQSSGYIHERKECRGACREIIYNQRNIQIYDAKIHICNALNVTATLTIYGDGIMGLPSMGRWLGGEQDTKSLTFIYVKNALPSAKVKQFTQNAIGHRRNGDKLIYFESRNVTNASRFPSRSFEYSGGEYITYVGFSFNSPTAMVMVNTSFVGEQEFNAVVYDMNTEHFVANMSVYGVKSIFRPDKFLGVI